MTFDLPFDLPFDVPFNLSFAAPVAAAFTLGLGASIHCALMCSPLACVACRNKAGARTAFQVGRLLAYSLLGALAGAFGRSALAFARTRAFGWFAQASSLEIALLAAACGLATAAITFRAFRSGTGLPVARLPTVALRACACAAGRGWGRLVAFPCGVLWSALALAGTTLDPARGAATLSVFAVASMPGLLAGHGLDRWLRMRSIGFRRSVRGMAILLATILIGRAALTFGTEAACGHPPRLGAPVPQLGATAPATRHFASVTGSNVPPLASAAFLLQTSPQPLTGTSRAKIFPRE